MRRSTRVRKGLASVGIAGFVVFASLAHAQYVQSPIFIPSGGGTVLPANGGTGVNNGTSTFTLNGNNSVQDFTFTDNKGYTYQIAPELRTSTGQNQISINLDPFPLVQPSNRWNQIVTTLAPSGNPTTIWENHVSSVTLVGTNDPTFTYSPEINVYGGDLTIGQPTDTGMTFASGESIEGRTDNYGTVSGSIAGFLAATNNFSTGSINFMKGVQLTPHNDNTTPGALATYAGINMEVMAGAGVAPTSFYLIRNVEPRALLQTEGQLSVGGTSPALPSSNTLVTFTGVDQLSSSFALKILDSAANTLFSVQDNGALTGFNQLTLGRGNSQAGKISFASATGTGATSLATTAGTQNNNTIFLPNVSTNDTIETLAATQTITGSKTFSTGTFNFTGTLQIGGVQGPSKTCGATIVVAQGVVTSC